MAITAAMVKELREKTGAGMLDCKKALVETDGDMNAAVDFLREKGIAKAAAKGDRIAAEGLTAVAVDGNKAALVEINSETDFVAKNERFQTLVQRLLSEDFFFTRFFFFCDRSTVNVKWTCCCDVHCNVFCNCFVCRTFDDDD